MKASFLGTVVVLAAAAVAQLQTTTLPICAQNCVTQFTSGSQIGGCGGLDVRCICSNTNFLNNIACCLAGTCDMADQQAAVAYAKQICTTAGVAVPDQVVCASSDASSTTASSAGSSASSTASSASSESSSTTTSVLTSTSLSTSANSISASATKNAAVQHGAAGMSFVGGLAAAIAFL